MIIVQQQIDQARRGARQGESAPALGRCVVIHPGVVHGQRAARASRQPAPHAARCVAVDARILSLHGGRPADEESAAIAAGLIGIELAPGQAWLSIEDVEAAALCAAAMREAQPADDRRAVARHHHHAALPLCIQHRWLGGGRRQRLPIIDPIPAPDGHVLGDDHALRRAVARHNAGVSPTRHLNRVAGVSGIHRGLQAGVAWGGIIALAARRHIPRQRSGFRRAPLSSAPQPEPDAQKHTTYEQKTAGKNSSADHWTSFWM